MVLATQTDRLSRVLGRDPELELIAGFVAADGEPRALELTGSPGIGKTTLWEAGIDAATAQGVRVLSSRPGSAQARLSFAGLIDLFDGVGPSALDALAPPQREALDAALLRSAPSGRTPVQAIALGALNVLRTLSATSRVLVAVDDVQWLDRRSAEVLAYAERRLESEPVRFLLARRSGAAQEGERQLMRACRRVEIGALSYGAMRRLLAERLGLSVSRQLLRRIVEVTLGNPLFALELGRELVQRGVPELGEDIPLPSGVEDLLGTRVASLRPAVRRLLVAVALSADAREPELASIEGTGALDDAIDAGVLIVDRGRVRPAHPLLAAAAKNRSGRGEQRKLHLALAAALADEELRATHLALASVQPDAGLSRTVAAAAASASARGAREEAVALAEHALRLTPSGTPERSERLLLLAEYLEAAGAMARMTELLEANLESLPHGSPRARAWLMLSEGTGPKTMHDMWLYRDNALAECGDDPPLRATLLAKKACNSAASVVQGIGVAQEWAQEALALSQQRSDAVPRPVLYALAWVRALTGEPTDDLCEASGAEADPSAYLAPCPERVAAQQLVWRGELSAAREMLQRYLELADERGELESYALMRLHMCELALRAGDCERAAGLLDEWTQSADAAAMFRPKYERCRALLAAVRGDTPAALRWASQALAQAEQTNCHWDGLEARRAIAIAALLDGRAAAAAAEMRVVWRHTEREGVTEPGVFPAAPELVEALVELGELDEARSVTARLRELAQAQAHPWGIVTAERCAALITLAAGGLDDGSVTQLLAAADRYDELGLRFDGARSLLALGSAQRRLKQWGQARRVLDQAFAAFTEIGSHGWAAAAQSQLQRVGARRPRPSGELTDTELRTALLAAAGMSNKQIAAELVVTVHTVEVHLSRAYAKLGVSSRGQLAGALPAADAKD